MKVFVVWLVLLALVVVSALRVVATSHEVRQLRSELDTLRQREAELLAEHSRLLLERGAVASLPIVEQRASEELSMYFPEHAEALAR